MFTHPPSASSPIVAEGARTSPFENMDGPYPYQNPLVHSWSTAREPVPDVDLYYTRSP